MSAVDYTEQYLLAIEKAGIAGTLKVIETFNNPNVTKVRKASAMEHHPAFQVLHRREQNAIHSAQYGALMRFAFRLARWLDMTLGFEPLRYKGVQSHAKLRQHLARYRNAGIIEKCNKVKKRSPDRRYLTA